MCEGNYTIIELMEGGFSRQEMTDGCSSADSNEMVLHRDTSRDVQDPDKHRFAKVSACPELEYSAEELKAIGSINDMLRDDDTESHEVCSDAERGPQEISLITASVREGDLHALSHDVRERKNASLKEGGFTVKDVSELGYTVREMRENGYTALELREAGITAWDIKNGGAGYSLEEMRAAGFSLSSHLHA